MDKKERKINKLFENFGSDGDWGMLGSCQYATIGDTILFINELIETVGREAFEQGFGITYSKELSLQEFEERLTSIVRDDIDNWIKIYEKEGDSDSVEAYVETREWLNSLGRNVTLDEYYTYCAENSWDLWSAAESPFEDFDFSPISEITKIGKTWNELIENEDFKIGVGLAYTMVLFGTPLDTFVGFDT